MAPTHNSPYAKLHALYIEQGYSVIPIAPGSKRPGQYTEFHGWRGMPDWTRFAERLPTDIETEHWARWPDAGIGLALGRLSGVVAVDRDYDFPGCDALEAIIPPSPVSKRGAKGYTRFYRYTGEESTSWNVGGARVLDLLSEGRQTVMPGTLHPEGYTYIWLTEDTLHDFTPEDLPALPADFAAQVARVLAPFQTDDDRKYGSLKADSAGPINTDLTPAAEYYAEIKSAALADLESWVPKLIPTARRERDGYRCIATWRNCTNPNVGIHPSGIYDFGGNYGLTPIDLVMHSCSVSLHDAVSMLRKLIPSLQTEEVTFFEANKPLPAIENTPPATTAVWIPDAHSVENAAPALPSFILNPPGLIGDISRWICDTAPKRQPELALAASIAIMATVMQRRYRSTFGNHTSLYVIMTALSTEGKEHPQQCAQEILAKAGLDHLIGPSGYTSAGGVISELLEHPSHLATIDEFGKMLKSSKGVKGTSTHTEGAIDKLVEAFGRCDGIMRAPSYSRMGATKKDAGGPPIIYNPAITVLGASTISTMYENLPDDLVHDGFLGRLLVVDSTQPRQLMQRVSKAPPPDALCQTLHRIHFAGADRGDLADLMAAQLEASCIPMAFSPTCEGMMREFEVELNNLKTSTQAEMLDMLYGRTLEKSMRLAMLVAKAKRPDDNTIQPEDLDWAITYVRHYDMRLVDAVRQHRYSTEHEKTMRKLLNFLAAAKTIKSTINTHRDALAQGAVPYALVVRHMGMDAVALTRLLDTARDAAYVSVTDGIDVGFPGRVVRLLK